MLFETYGIDYVFCLFAFLCPVESFTINLTLFLLFGRLLSSLSERLTRQIHLACWMKRILF